MTPAKQAIRGKRRVFAPHTGENLRGFSFFLRSASDGHRLSPGQNHANWKWEFRVAQLYRAGAQPWGGESPFPGRQSAIGAGNDKPSYRVYSDYVMLRYVMLTNCSVQTLYATLSMPPVRPMTLPQFAAHLARAVSSHRDKPQIATGQREVHLQCRHRWEYYA